MVENSELHPAILDQLESTAEEARLQLELAKLRVEKGELSTTLNSQLDAGDQSRAEQNPVFATPETLMQYYADCQFRGDTAGCLECYSDKVIDQFAATYLVGATAMLEMYRKIPDDELQDTQRKSADELEALLERSMIDDPPTIAKAGLYQAAGSIRERLQGDESREPTQNELMLTAASPSMLKNPRQFVLEFDEADETIPDESPKPERPKKYKIETDTKRTFAIATENNSRMELKKIDGRWWIDDPWAATDEAVDNDDVEIRAATTAGKPNE